MAMPQASLCSSDSEFSSLATPVIATDFARHYTPLPSRQSRIEIGKPSIGESLWAKRINTECMA